MAGRSRAWVRLLGVIALLWALSLVTESLGFSPGLRGLFNRLMAPISAPVTVPLVAVVASPGRYDGRRIRAIGYLHLEFEGDTLCPTIEFYKTEDAASCIWIEAAPQMRPLSDHYVIVEGQFSSVERGHLGMFSGSLQKVTRAQRWPPEAP